MMNDLRITTSTGKVEGYNITSWKDRNNIEKPCNIDVFNGIPYAKPPVGNLRWKPAEAVEPWNCIIKTRKHGVSMQCDFYGSPDFDCSKMDISEDCLYLDIWAPADRKRKNLPVLVWIHGGGWQSGSALLDKYNGTWLAQRGAIVVSVEYRVGIFGFFSHPELAKENDRGISGNYGLTDIREALKWIRANISAFGGDSTKITVFGQSSGGDIMTFLVASPYFTGTCDAVCIHSGTGAPTLPLKMKTGEENGKEFMNKLNASTLKEMRSLPGDKILDFYAKMYFNGAYMAEPVIDGYILPDHIFNLFKDGKINDIPFIISTTAEDTPLFMDMQLDQQAGDVEGYDEVQEAFSMVYSNERFDTRDYASVMKYLTEQFGDDAKRLAEIFLKKENGSEKSGDELRAGIWRLLNFDSPETKAIYYATRAAQINKNKPYMCIWERILPGWLPLNIGAFHEIELSYIFDCHWTGYPMPQPEAWDNKLIDAVQTFWIQFADRMPMTFEGIDWPIFDNNYLSFGNKKLEICDIITEAYEIFLKKYIKIYEEMSE